jgi:hypothetical protein
MQFFKCALSALLILVTAQAGAQVLSAACSDAKGTRFDLIGGSVNQDSDAFVGVRPQFVIAASNPKRLTVIWPDTRALGSAARQNAHEAFIIDNSPEMVTAIAVQHERATMYTLFPKKGLAYMSMHRQVDLGDGVANGSLFHMTCKFENN